MANEPYFATNYMERLQVVERNGKLVSRIMHNDKCVYNLLDSMNRWEPGLKEICNQYPNVVKYIVENENIAKYLVMYPDLCKVIDNENVVLYIESIVNDFPLAIPLICEYPNMSKVIYQYPEIYMDLVDDRNYYIYATAGQTINRIYPLKEVPSFATVRVGYRTLRNNYGQYPAIIVGRVQISGRNSSSNPEYVKYDIDNLTFGFAANIKYDLGFAVYLGRNITFEVTPHKITASDAYSSKSAELQLLDGNPIKNIIIRFNGTLTCYNGFDIIDQNGKSFDRLRFYQINNAIKMIYFKDGTVSNAPSGSTIA